MTDFTLNFVDLSQISTDAPNGFVDIGGFQFTWNVSTVTIAPGVTSQALTVTDLNNTTFDDDDFSQTLTTTATLNGTAYPAGTVIETEYVIVVQDSQGIDYTLLVVSANHNALNIVGFAAVGTMPPVGEALVVVSASDTVSGVYAYAATAPSCFGPHSRIALSDGTLREARLLRGGEMLQLATGGAARLDLILVARAATGQSPPPVRIRAGALGRGLPRRALFLSPQHRVHIAALNALVPARALTALGGIGTGNSPPAAEYYHLVLRQHALLLAEGLPCESFWPGKVALADLPHPLAARIRAIMGPAPRPAAPFLRMQDARRKLAALDLGRSEAAPG